MMDFYELLGIKKDATKEEIKKAYRDMVKRYHPDVNKSDEASKIIISLNEAKETLLDDDKRSEYDKLLNDINHSKTYSNDSTSYSAKKEEYKENYSESYVTRWQFLMTYLNFGKDKLGIKFLKTFIVIINYLVFFIIKAFTLIFLFLLEVFENLINYIGIILMIVGVYNFIEEEISISITLLICGILLILIKELILNKSVNIYAFIQNIHDKILIKVLTK